MLGRQLVWKRSWQNCIAAGSNCMWIDGGDAIPYSSECWQAHTLAVSPKSGKSTLALHDTIPHLSSVGECIFNPWLRIQNMNITMVGVRFRRYSAKAVSPSQRLSPVRVPVRKSIPPSFQIFTFTHVLTLWVQRSNANATLLNVKHKLQETLSNQNKTRGVSPVRHGQLS